VRSFRLEKDNSSSFSRYTEKYTQNLVDLLLGRLNIAAIFNLKEGQKTKKEEEEKENRRFLNYV